MDMPGEDKARLHNGQCFGGVCFFPLYEKVVKMRLCFLVDTTARESSEQGTAEGCCTEFT